MNILLFDIGGTGIQVYLVNKLDNILFKIDDVSTSNLLIEKYIIDLCQRVNNYQRVIIGVPADLRSMNEQRNVFSKPLNKYIDLGIFYDQKYEIVNDTIAILFLLDLSASYESNEYCILLTIGTSIGLCLFRPNDIKEGNIENAQSYEIAHELFEKFSDLLPSKTLRRKKIHQVYSVGGFCEFLGFGTTYKLNSIVKIDRENFVEILQKESLDKVKIIVWAEDLGKIISYYLAEEFNLYSITDVYLFGGLYNALEGTEYLTLIVDTLKKSLLINK